MITRKEALQTLRMLSAMHKTVKTLGSVTSMELYEVMILASNGLLNEADCKDYERRLLIAGDIIKEGSTLIYKGKSIMPNI